VRILGLCGSLRRQSLNRAALRAAQEVAPEGVAVHAAEIGDLPLYNEDARQADFPEPVQRLRSEISAADALLFVTPEYNYSVPGVLKNAIDWASRPPDQPFDGKPAAIMGVTGGNFGTARAQYHLRQMLVYLNVQPLNKPELFIGQARLKFDETGLTDEGTRELIRRQLHALQAWTDRLRA
jgi:chromate reductase, NAD(P)H dehydrogenase (quinone)